MIEFNKKVENFTLKGIDSNGNEKDFSLYDYIGQNIIIYFYPKDNTPGCTKEACDFRDNINKIASKAVILGVSPDKIASHLKFREKHDLNFPLLSDPDYKILKYFEVWGEKKMYGKTFLGVNRSTFLIDKNCIVRKKWKNVKVKGHVDQVLKALDEL